MRNSRNRCLGLLAIVLALLVFCAAQKSVTAPPQKIIIDTDIGDDIDDAFAVVVVDLKVRCAVLGCKQPKRQRTIRPRWRWPQRQDGACAFLEKSQLALDKGSEAFLGALAEIVRSLGLPVPAAHATRAGVT